MKIKELHKDIERYLQQDCYCPNEVYSFDGFGYQLFYEEQECELLGYVNKNDSEFVACVAHPFNEIEQKPQIVLFFLKGEKCEDALRYDATENNLKITKDILENGINGRRFNFDEYTKGSTAKTLQQILNIADAITIS